MAAKDGIAVGDAALLRSAATRPLRLRWRNGVRAMGEHLSAGNSVALRKDLGP